MARELDALVRFHQALTEARTAKDLLDSVPESMRELHEEHEARSGSLRSLEQQIDEADEVRKEAELAAQEAQAQLKHYQDQVSRVSTQREYGSLLTEIDTATAQFSEHEGAALSALERIDEATEAIEADQADFSDLDSRYQEALQEWEKEKPSVASRLKEVESEMDGLRNAIPVGTLLRFERLYDRLNGAALAPISKGEATSKAPAVWHCSSCNYRVRPQVVLDITNGNLNQCESCQRFLYSQEDTP